MTGQKKAWHEIDQYSALSDLQIILGYSFWKIAREQAYIQAALTLSLPRVT